MAVQAQAVVYEKVASDLVRWEVFSFGHQVELTSHLVVMDGRTFVFDPILLADEAMASLRGLGEPAAIVLTNENHERDAVRWRDELGVPIWASGSARTTVEGVQRLPERLGEWEGWKLHPIAGGQAGEMAFRWPGGSLVVFGDAVVHLAKRRLELLPDKYCSDPIELRNSLDNLLEEPFERLVTAHGDPMLVGASAALGKLL